jgi:hypothetical protein
MPNGTPRYPQPGIYPIPAALSPAFPFHIYNPPMPYSYTSNPLSLPQTPIATRQLEPHANSKRDIPSFELDFAASLFEGVIPGTASGGRQRKKFKWNETFDVEDLLLVLLRCMRRIGFETISDLLAALFATELCSNWKGRIAERLHFSSNRFSIHGREFTSGVPLSLNPPSQQISSQNYMIKTLGL